MNNIQSKTKAANFEIEITSDSGHTITSDEPEKVGGKNKGMSPDELIISALASCTSATLKMYAQHKEWNLEGVNTSIEMIPGENKGELPHIQRTIELLGDLDEEQRGRMLVIANKCPVHKMLSGELKIESDLG